MTLSIHLDKLETQLDALPRLGHEAFIAQDKAMSLVALMMVGAVKRSLSLGHGLIGMVNAKNMTCARALVRMQIDTISRLLAYTYVDDPEQVVLKVIGGVSLHTFKSKEGKNLRDGYLIDKMTESYPWVREVYRNTSGDVHFSEKQFFASVLSTDDATQTMTLSVSPFDDKYLESSWVEVVLFFYKLNQILINLLDSRIIDKNHETFSR